jgi:YesN/AraC family two-component response regulator
MNQSVTSQSDISILCVEDDPLSREFLGRIISIKFPEMNIHIAENGDAGLELFRKYRQDIVLTDISMPVMDGIRMAREIRMIEPDVHIIALSAHNDFDCQEEDLSLLFDRYLLKPANLKKICSTIDESIIRITTKKDQQGSPDFPG